MISADSAFSFTLPVFRITNKLHAASLSATWGAFFHCDGGIVFFLDDRFRGRDRGY